MTLLETTLSSPPPGFTPLPTATPEPLETLGDELTRAGRAMSDLTARIPEYLIRLALAALIVVVGYFLCRAGKRLIARLIARQERLRPETRRQTETLRSLLTSIYAYVLYFCIIMAALGTLGIDVTSLITVAGVGSIAIAFGAQTLVKDVISGLFLWTEGKIAVGDVVTVGEKTGTVEAISLRTTSLRAVDGTLYVVPNGDIRTVLNMSRDFRLAIVDLCVDYREQVTKTLQVLGDAMARMAEETPLENTPEVLGVINTTNLGFTVRITLRCAAGENWALEREIRRFALDRLLAEGMRMARLGVPGEA